MSWWKARAIYEVVGRFEFLSDRKNWSGDDARTLCAWLDQEALPKLRKELIERDIRPDSAASVDIDAGVFHLHASPNASYGYLYIDAWTDGSEDEMSEAERFPFFQKELGARKRTVDGQASRMARHNAVRRAGGSPRDAIRAYCQGNRWLTENAKAVGNW